MTEWSAGVAGRFDFGATGRGCDDSRPIEDIPGIEGVRPVPEHLATILSLRVGGTFCFSVCAVTSLRVEKPVGRERR